jgi:hypothetical protein
VLLPDKTPDRVLSHRPAAAKGDGMRVNRFDHVVLTVASIDATVDFYTRVLGMAAVTFGPGRTALRFGSSKINLHQAGHEFEPRRGIPRRAAWTCASSSTTRSRTCPASWPRPA